MAAQHRDNPYGPVDESTAGAERRQAENRLALADEGAERTADAVRAWRSLVGRMTEMHERNDYTRRLRPLYQGTHGNA